MQRLKDLGLTLNEKKCQFNAESMEFFGINFSSKGMSITEDKMKALIDAESPKTKSELRSYLGLASFCSKSIYNLAGKALVLWRLVRKGVNYEWTKECQAAFEDVKKSILTTALAYFNKHWNTILEVDASPIGAASVLMQENPSDSEERKIIACWSKRFTPTEEDYSQVEKEALGLVLSCERFRLYLLGQHFKIETDNKSVELILKNPRSKPPPRIARWNLRLSDYRFTVGHKPGVENVADYMSRNPVGLATNNTCSDEAEYFLNMFQDNYGPRAIKVAELSEETSKDTLGRMFLAKIKNKSPEFDQQLKSYKRILPNLSVSAQGLILMGQRIYVPMALRAQILTLAHEGHQGIVKTKRLLRNRMWFPSIDRAVEEMIGNCKQCEMNAPKRPEPLKMSTYATKPWQKVDADFYGPLPDGSEVLIMKDQHSKMVIAEEVKSTSAANVLPVIEKTISLIGIPAELKSDNGPPFNGQEFKDFCEIFGIDHKPVTPVAPSANGQVEAFMKNMTKIVKNARNGNKNWRSEMNAFLRSYRSTPHTSTGISPADLLFNNSNTSKLPKIEMKSNNSYKRMVEKALENNNKATAVMKANADQTRRAAPVPSVFKKDELVLLDQIKMKKIHSKYLDRYESKQYKIIDSKGSMVTVADREGREVTRDASWIKRGSPAIEVFEHNYDTVPSTPKETTVPLQAATPMATTIVTNVGPRRTTRISKQTEFYGDRRS